MCDSKETTLCGKVETAPRGFAVAEYETRLRRAQQYMAAEKLDALLLTTEAEVRYFSGFLTRFWESPTRPWYLIVPQSGAPVAVIPAIGAPLMAKTWICDIRTWQSPDLTDDGIGLLAATLQELLGKGASIGAPMGSESIVRAPLQDWENLKQRIAPAVIIDDGGIIRKLRMIKSPAEIEKIQTACIIAARAFARVGEVAAAGVPLSEVFRKFQQLCLQEGADWVAYLAGGAGANGCEDIISPATDTPLQSGDILMLDTGVVFDGYFCDYDRNYAVGAASGEMQAAWTQLQEATAAGQAAACVGCTAADIYHAMDSILTGGKLCGGRLGHGLGMQLTEWPSIMPTDKTEITEGMVITLEPYLQMQNGTGTGAIFVHEDNFAITAEGAVQLSPMAAAALPQLRV